MAIVTKKDLDSRAKAASGVVVEQDGEVDSGKVVVEVVVKGVVPRKYTAEVEFGVVERYKTRGPRGEEAFRPWFEAYLRRLITNEVY